MGTGRCARRFGFHRLCGCSKHVGTNATGLARPSALVQTFLHFRASAVTKLSAPVHGSANTTVTFTRVASLSFQAVDVYLGSNSTTGPSAGDTISYLFDVLNNGTTTLGNVEINPDLGSSTVCDPPLELLELAPGNKTKCRFTYKASGHPVFTHPLVRGRPCSSMQPRIYVTFLQQRNNNNKNIDDLPQVNQTNLDAGLVENSVTVNATSSVGATTAKVETDLEIERESSLIVGKSRYGMYGLLQEVGDAVDDTRSILCLYFELTAI